MKSITIHSKTFIRVNQLKNLTYAISYEYMVKAIEQEDEALEIEGK